MHSGVVGVERLSDEINLFFRIRIRYVIFSNSLRSDVVFDGPVDVQSAVRLTAETLAERKA